MNILQINSGVFSDNSQSTILVNSFVEHLKSVNAELEITIRDVISNPIPHLDAETLSAFMAPEENRSPKQIQTVSLSDSLINEIKAADSIVLGLPMYNFGVPSQLKAYFDQLARAGVTFKYTDKGPVGLLEDKPVYVLAARGGIHKGQYSDSQTAFIKTFFNFLGLENVKFIYAEGLNMGDDVKDQAINIAKQSFDNVLK